MNNVLSDLPGVLCHLDYVLVYGKDSAEHESRLQVALQRIQAVGITFCQFCVSFLGYVIESHLAQEDHCYT